MIIFYGLLHIKENENLELNFHHKNHKEKILIYLKNALHLSNSLKRVGFKFILITNNKLFLRNIYKNIDDVIEVEEIIFSLDVPRLAKFYACHFRIDVFEYLSLKKNTYSVLLDLDVVAINEIPETLIYSSKNKINLVHDISEQVNQAYGILNIKTKLESVLEKESEGIWYGGDFFSGTDKFYFELAKYTKFFHFRFINKINILSNETDELFISAAIETIKIKNNFLIKDANKERIISRYWSGNIKHKQKNISNFYNYFLLHFPADKIFISKNYKHNYEGKIFMLNYINYINSFKFRIKKKISLFLPNFLKRIVKKII